MKVSFSKSIQAYCLVLVTSKIDKLNISFYLTHLYLVAFTRGFLTNALTLILYHILRQKSIGNLKIFVNNLLDKVNV